MAAAAAGMAFPACVLSNQKHNETHNPKAARRLTAQDAVTTDMW